LQRLVHQIAESSGDFLRRRIKLRGFEVDVCLVIALAADSVRLDATQSQVTTMNVACQVWA